MRIRVAVIGAGSWGTTVAHLTAHNVPTVLWARDPQVAAEVRDEHRNSRYLAGFDLHPMLEATADLEEAVCTADVVVMGVPSHGFRTTLECIAGCVRAWVPFVSLTKGLEQGTRKRMTQIINETVPGHPYGLLTGPNLAKEILAGDAAAAVLAMSDATVAAELQPVFATNLFRVYTNDDIVGSELAGALKNVMAIASGMADGLGTGDNTRAAVITRGLAELTRLGVAMGGEPMTFAGLAGMGDLVATCISRQSRNRHVGEQLGRGHTIEQIIEEMQQVAEGVKTAGVVMELAAEHGIDMPIVEQVFAACHQGRTANEAYRGLLRHEARHELDGMPGRLR
ncbi:MAG: NAD(P)H-dependent glycerol-3-phosphate dehydrogenase [Acidimicrobiales bacterium]|nr:NAD(P)H-dependent glycerol-3-phosphate dehydrogenase [Acidimicrobiales bacterium]